MSAHDGGPAFPQPCHVHEDGTTEWTKGNLSLRDHFAGLALQGLLADTNYNETPATTADVAYKHADAMLVARGSAGPDFEAEREAKIEAWLQRDKLANALRELLKKTTSGDVEAIKSASAALDEIEKGDR